MYRGKALSRVEHILVKTEAPADGSAPISPPWSSTQLSMRGSHLQHILSSQSSDFRYALRSVAVRDRA